MLLKVLRSYLDQRKQFVQIGDARSELLDVTSGVPQGSLLGPLLFIIYVADLPLNLVSETFMFADDTKILSIHQKILNSRLQENLSSLEEWCRSNYMSFNVGKCSIVTFSRTEPTDLALYGKPLAHSSLEKDLGLLVSDKLKWKDHITGACSKSNRVLNLIKRNVGHRVSTKHRKDLYKSMVIPILLYGSTAWSPSKGDLRLIGRVQRRATYWMLNY